MNDLYLSFFGAFSITLAGQALDTMRHTLNAHTGWVPACAFTPDGRIVASSDGDETIKFWDVQTGTCTHTLRVPGPYEGMNITAASGISDAQKSALKALGALEQ